MATANLHVSSVVFVQILLAVALALASAVCYSASAVLQHREVAAHQSSGLHLVARLVRRRGWWIAIAATVLGALLHLAALGTGALLLVQPLGVTALVFALLIDARMNRTTVDGTTWLGAACIVLGLPAVLSAIPRHAAPVTPVLGYWAVAAAVALLAGVLATGATLIRRRLPRAAPVLYAVAAAVCFGLTSGTAKAVWLGNTAPIVIGAGLISAAAGVVLAQHAYRDGGLGAPLATLTLVDPLAAGFVAVLALGEPISTTPLHLAIGLAGALATAVGVVLLSPRGVMPTHSAAAHHPLVSAEPAGSAA
jgi:drug/metabolite transporter (DMT)-like permease